MSEPRTPQQRYYEQLHRAFHGGDAAGLAVLQEHGPPPPEQRDGVLGVWAYCRHPARRAANAG